MGARLRSFALVASVVLATIGAPAATGGAAACADEGPHAALVVGNGARIVKLCVTLDAAEVSGLRLIELAAAQHGLSYGFGLGGAAVCRLDGVGPGGDDCFAEYPDFWGYWHGDGRGGWAWAGTGAASYRIGDGDVEGWTWGAGDTGATHPKPPATDVGGVCVAPEPSASPSQTQSPKPNPKPEPTPKPSQPSSPPSASSSASPSTTPVAGETRDPSASPKADKGTATEEPSPSAAISPSPSPSGAVLAVGPPSGGSGGAPVGLLVAIVLGVALTVGGWLRLRGRSKVAT